MKDLRDLRDLTMPTIITAVRTNLGSAFLVLKKQMQSNLIGHLHLHTSNEEPNLNRRELEIAKMAKSNTWGIVTWRSFQQRGSGAAGSRVCPAPVSEATQREFFIDNVIYHLDNQMDRPRAMEV